MPSTQIHTIYKKKDGTRVPSVTTYLGILAKPALIHWAWEQGVAGLDYRKVRDQSGDIGTLVHYLIFCQLKDGNPDLSDYTQQDIVGSEPPMKKFRGWRKEHTLEPILLETPIVSEFYGFGGTPDYYGLVDGVATLIDFKTSEAFYLEHFCQLAAYERLLTGAGFEVEKIKLLRFGKKEGEGFGEQTIENTKLYWRIFLACQEIYELVKLIKKVSRGKQDSEVEDV